MLGKQAALRTAPIETCGDIMIRLDLSYFYRVASEFGAFRTIDAGEPLMSGAWQPIMQLRDRIQQIVSDQMIGYALRGIHSHGNSLLVQLNSIIDRDWNEIFSEYEKGNIISSLNGFEVVFTSEISVADAYFVVGKRGLDTLKLVSEGEILFNPDLPKKVPQAVHDLREAGKCLAFELGTAAGFHLLRAVESVVRRYWEIATGHRPKPKQRNLGVYLDAMRRLEVGDSKIIAALTQIKDLHRNVIMHPEENLDVNDAVALLGIANSAIDAMLKTLPIIVQQVLEPEDQTFPGLDLDASNAAE